MSEGINALKNRLEFPSLIIGLQNRKGNRHEIEFFNVYSNSRTNSNNAFDLKRKIFAYELGYSFLLKVAEALDGKFVFFFGLGGSTLFNELNRIPDPVGSVFPVRITQLKLYFNFSLEIRYKPVDHLLITFGIPISWTMIGYKNQYIDNPTIAEEARGSTEAYRQIPFYLPERLGFRLGVGYAFK